MDMFIVLLDEPRTCERCSKSRKKTNAPYLMTEMSDTGEVVTATALCSSCLSEDEQTLLVSEQHAVSMAAFNRIWNERMETWKRHEQTQEEMVRSMTEAAQSSTPSQPTAPSAPVAADWAAPAATTPGAAKAPASEHPVAQQRPFSSGLIRRAADVAVEKNVEPAPAPEPVPANPPEAPARSFVAAPATGFLFTSPEPAKVPVSQPALVSTEPKKPVGATPAPTAQTTEPVVQPAVAAATKANTQPVAVPEPATSSVASISAPAKSVVVASNQPQSQSVPAGPVSAVADVAPVHVSAPVSANVGVSSASLVKSDLVPSRSELAELALKNQAELVCKMYSHEWYLYNGDIYHVEIPRRVSCKRATDLETAAVLILGQVCEQSLAA